MDSAQSRGLLIEVKMVFRGESPAHPTYRKKWLLFCHSLVRCNGAGGGLLISGIMGPLESPLGLTEWTEKVVRILYWTMSPLHVMESQEVCSPCIPNKDVPDHGWYPQISTVAQILSSHLNTRKCPSQNEPNLNIFLHLSHCLWSSCLVQPITVILYPKSPPLG